MVAETDEHDTVTAEMGTVAQLVKAVELACTVKFHEPLLKSRFDQLTVAAELPASVGAETGLVAVNETVAGLTVRLKLAAGLAACAFCGRRTGRLWSAGLEARAPFAIARQTAM